LPSIFIKIKRERVGFTHREILLSMILIFLTNSIFAQRIIDSSSKNKPSWLVKPPKGKYFKYYSGMGSSQNSLGDAREQAIASVLSEVIMEGEIVVSSVIRDFYQEKNSEIISDVSREILQKGTSTIIKGLSKEEEYRQTKKIKNGLLYECWILMKMPKAEYIDYGIPVQKGYGFSPIWRSSIIPGWGQFHKGEPQKGWRFLISETVCVSSFFISNYFSQNYNRKAENEREYDKRKFYNDWSNRSYTIGTVSGIVAGAIYIYNVFDSVTAKGAKRYAFQNSSSSLLSLSFYIDF